MKDVITPIEWKSQFQTPTYLELEKMSDAEIIAKQNKLASIITSDKDFEKLVWDTRDMLAPLLPDIIDGLYVPETVKLEYTADVRSKNYTHTRSVAIIRIIIYSLSLQVVETVGYWFNQTHSALDLVLALSPDCHIHYRSASPHPEITVY